MVVDDFKSRTASDVGEPVFKPLGLIMCPSCFPELLEEITLFDIQCYNSVSQNSQHRSNIVHIFSSRL